MNLPAPVAREKEKARTDTLRLRSDWSSRVVAFLSNNWVLILVLMRFDLYTIGLERSGRLKGIYPPIVVNVAWCGDELWANIQRVILRNNSPLWVSLIDCCLLSCRNTLAYYLDVIQPEHRDKNIPGLTRAPYDLRFSWVFRCFLWLS